MKQEIIEKAHQLVQAKQHKEAIRLLEEFLVDREDEDILLELGVIYNGIADFTGALNSFNAVLRINPDNGKARTYVTMINNILNYFNKDLINP